MDRIRKQNDVVQYLRNFTCGDLPCEVCTSQRNEAADRIETLEKEVYSLKMIIQSQEARDADSP